MGKYIELMKFAFKEQLEYKWNFIFSMFIMVINDLFMALLFWIFFNYFSDIGLSIFDYLLMLSIIAFYYGIIGGVIGNLRELNYIIETGRLDYYLSFPMSSLKMILFTKIKVQELGDIFFAIISIFLYVIFYTHNYMDILIWLLAVLIGVLGMIGLLLIFSSLSFILDRASEIKELFLTGLISIGDKPPQIYESNKLVFFVLSFLGLFPIAFLPYYIVSEGGSIYNWIYLILINLFLFILGNYFFRKGLKKYTSGNLVVQM